MIKDGERKGKTMIKGGEREEVKTMIKDGKRRGKMMIKDGERRGKNDDKRRKEKR